jgi:hypothetical protein
MIKKETYHMHRAMVNERKFFHNKCIKLLILELGVMMLRFIRKGLFNIVLIIELVVCTSSVSRL